MPSLDPYTLAAVSALAAFFMAVTMGGMFVAGNREAAIADWALAGVLFCFGHVVAFISLGEAASGDNRMALAVANSSVVMGYSMLLVGILRHLGLRRWTGHFVLLALGVGLAIGFIPIMYESTVFRVATLTVVYTGLSAAGAFLLWRADERPLAAYRRAMGAVLIANALVLVLRAGYVMLDVRVSADASGSIVLVPIYLSAILFYMALNVSLALMLFRRKEVHLRFLARHDALTGLLNRYSLGEYSSRELARARRGEQTLSLAVIDLDNFKAVNDRYGHGAGDQVLLQAAKRMKEIIREGDIAFRIGGEEFLMLLPGADQAEAGRIAERLRLALADRPFECRNSSVRVSASVGVVTFSPDRDDWEELVRRADQALYRAKEKGRNRVEWAREDSGAYGAE